MANAKDDYEKQANLIILNAEKKMQAMLKSIYNYNLQFAKTKQQKELLLKILFSMGLVDRKFFTNNNGFYLDTALSIGKGQTISQPSTVARMLLLLELKTDEDVLEIGAGSGWNASLISFLCYPGNVSSIDRINELVKKAKTNFKKFTSYLKQKKPSEFTKFTKLNFYIKNIFNNRINQKYDKIIFTAGISNKNQENKLQEIAKNLLKQNGILTCPNVSGPILIYKKQKNKIEKIQTGEQYVFVPLLEGVE